MSVFSKFTDDMRWRLTTTNRDPAISVIGQYIVDDVSHELGVNIGSVTSLGRVNPIISFLSGEQEKFSFKSTMISDFFGYSVETRFNNLIKLVKPDNVTKSIPLVLFEHATITVVCLVKKIGGIKYYEPRSDGILSDPFSAGGPAAGSGAGVASVAEVTSGIPADPGSFFGGGGAGALKRVDFTIELWKYQLSDDFVHPASNAPQETTYVVSKYNDFYEKIAKRILGDPLLGVNIRKENQKPFLEVGDVVKVFDADHPNMMAAIKPDNFLLKRTANNLSAFNDILNSRNTSRLSFV